MKSLFHSARKSRRFSQSSSASKHVRRKTGFEQFEARQMMSVSPVFVDIPYAMPTEIAPYDPPVRFAEGSINLNTATGTLTIEGSNNYNDKIDIYINHRAGNGAGDLPDLLTISLANVAGTTQVRAFNLGEVTKIIVNTYGGNDFVDNRTWIPMTANGGIGDDVLMGSLVEDTILGGDGHDFIDGRRGGDILYGQLGHDKIFGDEGFDLILGGDGNDFLFGGHDDDSIYGEAGDDIIFGGLGADRLIDTVGTNSMYADFGSVPSSIPTVKNFRQFYMFDRNFNDAAVRSLVRLSYRDMLISRKEMMSIINVAATDGVESVLPYNGSVSSNEFHDLKYVLSTNWPMQMRSDVKYLANRVINGDTANAHYRGESLGNLAAGVQGAHLTKLVDKWFKGGDMPEAADESLRTLRYAYVNGSLFVNGASYTDVDQGSTNSCYLLAALGEVAEHSPATIEKMFTDNGDGTFTVRFFRDGKSVYVTVNRMLPVYGNGFAAPFAAGWGSYADEYGMSFQRDASDAANELWVGLAEKAYAQLNESGGIGQDGTNTYVGIDFGYSSTVFKQITNRSASDTSIGDNKSSMITALNAGKAITLSSKTSDIASSIVTKHVYMLVGYDSATQKFELYNPHGPNSSESQPMTVFVTWNEIRKSFAKWTSVSV